jgi:tetratricopeptide (TPR) repeat protein
LKGEDFMKKNYTTRLILIALLILVSITAIACEGKDKQKVISNDVSMDAKKDENLIQKNIELGNNYIKEDKYDEAKQSYEKAISLDRGNKQTYLTIKDKYLEKGRLDDAYYIVKSAIKSNVDTANMNTILAQISEKFEMANIQERLQQGNKYTLPDAVTMKINGVDTKVFVKWNNSSAIDTSKAGNFTYEGKSEQYGRKVKLRLYVTVNVVNEQISGTIKKVYESNGKKYLTVHEVDFYLGDQAKLESKKDGVSLVNMDYYIRDKKTEKDYIISDGASLSLLQNWIDINGTDVSNKIVAYDQFKNVLNSRSKQVISAEMEIRRNLSWLTINNNIVTEVYGPYTP